MVGSELEHAVAGPGERVGDAEQLVTFGVGSGTSSPDFERWIGVREVENPSAPARSPRSTMSAIAAMSSSVGGSLAAPRSPIT
jgi:hypothetical protein